MFFFVCLYDDCMMKNHYHYANLCNISKKS